MADKHDDSMTVKMTRSEKAAAEDLARRMDISISELARRGLRRIRTAREAEERRARKKSAP